MQKLAQKKDWAKRARKFREEQSCHLSEDYELLFHTILPHTVRTVNVYRVGKAGLIEDHHLDLVKQYRASFSPDIRPTPKADYWIVVLDSKTNCCLGTIAICLVDDDSAPFVFHKVPKGKAQELLEVFNYVMKLDNNCSPGASLNDIEAGSFSIQKNRLGSFSELLDIASLLFYAVGKQGIEMGGKNAILAVTKSLRGLYRRLDIPFYQFPRSSIVFSDNALEYKQVEKRMYEDMKISDPNIVNLILEHYLEVHQHSSRHAVQSGILNIQETISSLENRDVIKNLFEYFPDTSVAMGANSQ